MGNIMNWYTVSYSIFLGLAGIFFTLFTVIYALIDNKNSSISFLESKKKRGNASPRQKSDLSYWTDYRSSLRALNKHVLALFILSVVLSVVFVMLYLSEMQNSWLTWIMAVVEVALAGYIIYVFTKFIMSYFKNMKD